MLGDRKIKKQLDKELKPTISAERFCSEIGLSFVTQDTPKQHSGKNLLAKVFLPIASVAAVCLCIVLPLTLGKEDEPDDQLKYGESDAVYVITEIESIYSDENILIFNQSYVQMVGASYLINPIDSDTKLGYRISEVLYAEAVDGVPSFAVTFDFLVRCYEGYTINSTDLYSNADKVFTQNGISFNYCIIGGNQNPNAYICFKYGTYDYFIQLSSYGPFTEINDDSVQLFIRKAFMEETQKNEAVSGRKVDS
ncbi:MAG: hypothetical protein HDT28_01635 [Clostridiales bacterium]|nr:hypothetical protein [Clostridiales bacterium]